MKVNTGTDFSTIPKLPDSRTFAQFFCSQHPTMDLSRAAGFVKIFWRIRKTNRHISLKMDSLWMEKSFRLISPVTKHGRIPENVRRRHIIADKSRYPQVRKIQIRPASNSWTIRILTNPIFMINLRNLTCISLYLLSVFICSQIFSKSNYLYLNVHKNFPKVIIRIFRVRRKFLRIRPGLLVTR